MKRRILSIVLAAAGAGAALAGCENLKEYRRTSSDDPAVKQAVRHADADGDSKDEPEQVIGGGSNPRSIFKSTRLPGALSSEGADIERSLGVR